MNTEDDRGKDQARCQIESIVEMVAALKKSQEGDSGTEENAAERAIQEHPLSVEVRVDWHTPWTEDQKPTEFKILLCWGGPACQIVGDLDEYGQPENPVVEYQDWGTPWTAYRETTDEQDEALLAYCQQFYFGE